MNNEGVDIMLESFNVNNEMQYQKLSLDEQQKRGILGRLVGVIADFKNPTRNGRRYTEELWDKTFADPIMKEKLENRCLFGELGHPVDRQEIDMEKIAICLAEAPKKGNDGKLYGVFDILATPNGRILKTMCDYGCKIGVSSRGSGDTIEDYEGGETVEPDTYECECWDAVLLPAVKSARPQYVKESLDTSKKTFKKALREALESSPEDEKKVMEQTLNELEIDYSAEQEDNPEKVDNIDTVANEPKVAAEDNGAEVLRELQEAVKANKEQEKQIEALQRQVSVCYTKEARYSEVLDRTKKELAQAADTIKTLSEQLEATKSAQANAEESVTSLQKKNAALTKRLSEGLSRHKMLSEGLSGKDRQIKSLQEQVTTLNEAHSKKCAELEESKKRLTEELQESKKDSQIVRSQASAKISQANTLTEKYKSIAKTAVDRYISLQAKRLGVGVEEIRNRLNENYSFNDIDSVCETLQNYKLTVNSLPFNVTSNKPVKMTIKESKETIVPVNNDDNRFDDEIDSTLNGFI